MWLFGAKIQEQTFYPGRIKLIENWPNLKSTGEESRDRLRNTRMPLCFKPRPPLSVWRWEGSQEGRDLSKPGSLYTTSLRRDIRATFGHLFSPNHSKWGVVVEFMNSAHFCWQELLNKPFTSWSLASMPSLWSHSLRTTALEHGNTEHWRLYSNPNPDYLSRLPPMTLPDPGCVVASSSRLPGNLCVTLTL